MALSITMPPIVVEWVQVDPDDASECSASWDLKVVDTRTVPLGLLGLRDASGSGLVAWVDLLKNSGEYRTSICGLLGDADTGHRFFPTLGRAKSYVHGALNVVATGAESAGGLS